MKVTPIVPSRGLSGKPAAPRPLVGVAMRRTLAAGYTWSKLRADAMAGVVVGVVALPLSMALSIAVGAPPQHGLYTAIVAGLVVSLTGGSKHQVTGPTAAFVVVLAPIVARHGLAGLLTAGMMAGVLLVLMGFARLGHFVEFIPYLGGLVRFVVVCLGLGAFAWQLYRVSRPAITT